MRFLSPLTFILASLLDITYSFCIYNKHEDETFLVALQFDPLPPSPHGFYKTIYPGYKQCCPYTNSDCNPNGSSDHDTLKIMIHYYVNAVQELSRFSVTMPSGGWITSVGNREQYNMIVKYANGTDYPTIIKRIAL